MNRLSFEYWDDSPDFLDVVFIVPTLAKMGQKRRWKCRLTDNKTRDRYESDWHDGKEAAKNETLGQWSASNG